VVRKELESGTSCAVPAPVPDISEPKPGDSAEVLALKQALRDCQYKPKAAKACLTEIPEFNVYDWQPYLNSDMVISFPVCGGCELKEDDESFMSFMRTYVVSHLATFPATLDHLKPSTERVTMVGKQGSTKVWSVSERKEYSDGVIEWASGTRMCEGRLCVEVHYDFLSGSRCSQRTKLVPVDDILRLNQK
jgi:hypothetical protein